MITFGASVAIGVVRSELVAILAEAAHWSVRTGIDVEVISIFEHRPFALPQTMHQFDLAADLTTRGSASNDLARLTHHLQRTLPLEYTLLLEPIHVHVEWNVRRSPSVPSGS